MYIGVDFDGTCVKHRYPEVGEDIGAVPVLKKIAEKGHKIILITMRGDNKTVGEAKQWFIDNEIPLYAINQNPSQFSWSKSRKIYAHYYIDDQAIGIPLIPDTEAPGRYYVDWVKTEQLLKQQNII